MTKVLERDLYEADFFAWTQHQSKELRRFARTRPNLPLDLPHLAEEIADLGKEQRNALRSWTVRISSTCSCSSTRRPKPRAAAGSTRSPTSAARSTCA